MHVSVCISSHNFTYIIHIFVYAILIPLVQFSLHLKSKWLNNYSKSLPERTKSVLLFFFSILVLHNIEKKSTLISKRRSPHIDGHMEPRKWRTPDFIWPVWNRKRGAFTLTIRISVVTHRCMPFMVIPSPKHYELGGIIGYTCQTQAKTHAIVSRFHRNKKK